MTGIDLTPGARTLLDYLLHDDAYDYIRSALVGYQLLVHEFGPDIAVEFTLNTHDHMTPMLKLRMDAMPDDVMDRIGRIRETLTHLVPGPYARRVLVTI